LIDSVEQEQWFKEQNLNPPTEHHTPTNPQV